MRPQILARETSIRRPDAPGAPVDLDPEEAAMESRFVITIDPRPETWGDAQEFFESPERGRAPRSKLVRGQERLPDELVPDGLRGELHHREWSFIQRRTTVAKNYTVYWVHGNFIPPSHGSTQKKYGHFDSWLLIVDDAGRFLDVPAAICSPAM
jgi:hypothetical protein